MKRPAVGDLSPPFFVSCTEVYAVLVYRYIGGILVSLPDPLVNIRTATACVLGPAEVHLWLVVSADRSGFGLVVDAGVDLERDMSPAFRVFSVRLFVVFVH